MIPMKSFLKSRKFLFTVLSVVLWCVGVMVFKLQPMETASSLTILFAPYLVANVVEKLKKPKG